LAGSKSNDQSGTGNSGTELPPAVRREQPEIGSDEEFEERQFQDISVLVTETSGRALNSPAYQAHLAQQQDEKRRQEKRKQEHLAQEARELANLTQWNKQRTSVAGVEMTNEEAQTARRRYLAHADEYTDEAVKAGLIREDQKEALKAGMQRKVELEDKVGRGIATDDDRKELKSWDQSDLGKAGDKITAAIHQNQDLTSEIKLKSASASANDMRLSAATATDVFQSAPALKSDFTEKVAALDGQQPKSPVPPPPAKKLEATGLDV
jgi:hypothetical protein